jgi:aldose 1-epimerase
MGKQNDFRVDSRRTLRVLTALAVLVLAAGGGARAGDVREAVYGKTSDGKTVHAFTLTNNSGASARVLDYGGAITEINVPDRTGALTNVVLSLADVSAYETASSLNSLIGRYANRLKNGFSIDGKHYDLPANAHGVTLHGGQPFYSGRIWDAKPLRTRQGSGVVMQLTSPDGDQSFPGTVKIKVTYILTNTNDFRIEYEATTDKPTVINLTSHTYFNLAGNGTGPMYDQELQVMADQYTPFDADQVPTGVIAPLDNTALDFRTLTPIGARISPTPDQNLKTVTGYDHNWVLRSPGDGSVKGGQPPLAVRMYDRANGRILELRTDQPGVQIYSANGFRGGIKSVTGGDLQKGAGLALETQHYPDSPNHPNFPSTELRPGQTFRSTTIFHFTTDKGTPLPAPSR